MRALRHARREAELDPVIPGGPRVRPGIQTVRRPAAIPDRPLEAVGNDESAYLPSALSVTAVV